MRSTLKTLTLLAAAAALAVTVAAADDSKDHWKFQAELTGRFDDNILELSDTDRARVGDPAFTGRFRIDTPYDFVTIPSGRVTFSGHLAPGFETTLRADARAYVYQRNSVKNYESADLRLSQGLTRARKYETHLILGAAYIPSFYVKELKVAQASLVQGTTVRDSATYSSMDYSAGIEQVLVPKHLEAALLLDREDRNYNSAFDERDGTLDSVEGRLSLSPGRGRRLAFTAALRTGTFTAAGDRSSTPAFESDVSSDRRSVSLGTDLRWGRGKRGTISLDYQREIRDYTSSNPADTYHFGRTDVRTEAGVNVRQFFTPLLFLDVSLSREVNASSLQPGAQRANGDDVTDFTRDIIAAGFGLKL